ncbi:MAG TPA: ABC transporter permease subunit [Thermomicrobiales bacterium]|nr:ABC transporter permease subunit [Thermomicrobiales bacterium]
MSEHANGVAPGRYGEVFDRGYAHYDGPREGRRRAVKSLFVYSIKRAMGIRKSWTAKVLPVLLYVSSFVPLIVMIGIAALLPDANVASYPDYFDGIFFLVGIFAGTVIPEILIPDRQEKTLPLYFARAITRFDYVIAKLAAAAVLTMTISVLPAIILWLGRQLTAESPWSAMRDNIGDLGQVIVLGTLIALTLGTIALVISAMTDRKGVAIAVIVIAFLIVSGLVELALTELDQDWRRYLAFGHMQLVFSAISASLFNAEPNMDVQEADLPTWMYYAWICFIIIAGSLFVRWRYSPGNTA